MKIKWKPLIAALALPLAVGGLSALFTSEKMKSFGMLEQPPLSPPAWLFPVAWTILYLLMGWASYLVYTSGKDPARVFGALTVYGIQLFFNFFWSIFFFNLEWYLVALIWLIALWLLILYTAILFYRINRMAGYLMIPYLIWVTFAAYLNAGIYILN